MKLLIMVKLLKKVLKSIFHASVGIFEALKERNMRIHVLAMVIVVVVGLVLDYTRGEWLIIIFLIAAVMSAEVMNTAVEEVCNIIRDRLRLDYAATRRARDLAAGAVLIIAIAAAVIWLMIIVPKLDLLV
jgi:diacylglycerol kinase